MFSINNHTRTGRSRKEPVALDLGKIYYGIIIDEDLNFKEHVRM